MSDDYKAAFRAAQAQRGLAAKPTKEQLKALKAKKAAPAAAVPQRGQPAAAVITGAGSKPAAGLPADFFDAKGGSAAPKQQPAQPAAASQPHQQQQQQQQQQLAGTKRPAAAVAGGGGSRGAASETAAAAADAAVPKGFFDDKAADKKARGIKEPGKKDKEAAFAEFSAAIDDQLKQQAAEEDEEAEDAAREREAREAFEQQLRMQRAAELKALKSNPAGAATAVAIDDAVAAAVPAAGKRRRVVDVLQEVLGAGSEEGSEDTDEEDGALLDWRAKAV